MSRPAFLRPGLAALVATGGAAGTAARYLIATAWPPLGGLPVATLIGNVAGAFLLGLLPAALAGRGPESPRGQRIRLGLGTGVLGGFTTFSGLALETARLLGAGRITLAIAYAGGSVLLGLGACLAGTTLAAGWIRTRPPRLWAHRPLPPPAPRPAGAGSAAGGAGPARAAAAFLAVVAGLCVVSVGAAAPKPVGVVVLLAAIGGLGAAARFLVDGVVTAALAGRGAGRPGAGFPLGTLVVNVSGSLLIGIVAGAVTYLAAGEPWRLVLATGFCGGYTTFSTAMVETMRLARSGRAFAAVGNAAGTPILTVLAAAAGIGLVAAVAG